MMQRRILLHAIEWFILRARSSNKNKHWAEDDRARTLSCDRAASQTCSIQFSVHTFHALNKQNIQNDNDIFIL